MQHNQQAEPKQLDDKYKVWFIVRTDINMPKGKVGSQCGHGIVELMFGEALKELVRETPRGENSAWEEMRWMAPTLDWYRDGQTKIALKGGNMMEVLNYREQLFNRGLLVKEVVDNGNTMFNGEKTLTLIAVGPCKPADVHDIIGHLKPL